MPIPVYGTTESSTTTVDAWKKLFQASETNSRTGATIRCERGGEVGLMVALRVKGQPAPADDAEEPIKDEMYFVSPGETFPMDAFADSRVDIYVRSEDGTAVPYLAWEVVGR